MSGLSQSQAIVSVGLPSRAILGLQCFMTLQGALCRVVANNQTN